MSTDSVTSYSNCSESDESLNKKLLIHQIRGLPDIFSPAGGVRRLKENQEMRINLNGKDFICRICHGGESAGNLIAACKCRGSIALTHLNCLEIWLNESNRNACELCQYHFRIIREPKFGVLWSIFMFLRHPDEHLRELLVDLVTLIVYTPSTVTSTYMLMLLCESLSKTDPEFRKTILSHVMAFSAIFAINFIYTSWLILTIEKYVDYWQEWYKKNSSLRVILSDHKIPEQEISSCEPPESRDFPA